MKILLAGLYPCMDADGGMNTAEVEILKMTFRVLLLTNLHRANLTP